MMQTLPLATNPIEQIVGWSAEFGYQVFDSWEVISTAIAFGLAVYLAFVLYERFQDDSDPSVRLQSSSGGGSLSILLSGTHVTALLLAGIALLTWPLPIAEPFIAMAMVGVLATHYYLEKREVSMN